MWKMNCAVDLLCDSIKNYGEKERNRGNPRTYYPKQTRLPEYYRDTTDGYADKCHYKTQVQR